MDIALQRSEEVSDSGVRGICVVWMFAFVRWAMSFSLLLYERRGEGRELLVIEHTRWKDARQMSVHTFPPFSLHPVCLTTSVLLCLSSSLFPTFPSLSLSLSLLFSPLLWGLEASQTAPGWNQVWKHPGDISVIIKPALRLPNTSSLMCTHRHMHTRAHIHTHTPPGRVKQLLLSQKIDIKKAEEQKIPFWLEVEGIVVNLLQCDGKMVNTCQRRLLKVQSLQSAFLEVFSFIMIPPHPAAAILILIQTRH